jgi:membrane associated rhomboid family serine protease
MRQIPNITKNLLIINIICYMAKMVLAGRIDFGNVFGLHFFLAEDFHIHQLLTYMFMHANFTHLFFNMFALWMFGGTVERTFGEKRFLIYYIICGLGAAICQEISQFVQIYAMLPSEVTIEQMFHLSYADRMALNAFTTVGASGCVYGILLAFGMSYPEERIFIFPLPVPVKAKWFVIAYAAIELGSALSSRGDGVAHVAHLGGMLFGYFLIKYWRKTSDTFNGWDGYEIR